MIDMMILEEAIKKAKEELALKLESGTSGTGSALAQLKASLEEKLSPWTGTRAAKLDRLDVNVSSRANGSYYTPARGTKLDNLDAKVSSRADGKDWTAERAGKVDKLDVAVSTRASQTSVDNLTTAVSNMSSGAVKRVQKGKGEVKYDSVRGTSVKIPYSINIDKSYLLFYKDTDDVIGYISDNETIVFYKKYSGTTNIAWEVVECY